ncbi:MAG: hypothetical protein DMG96_04715 [Acidobacteria bacterium]|nr:MAG: hypothetical protein DMG96_04715 [Acidobacteriota bacterium]
MVGAFTPASNATSLLLYIEGASATSSYYVDDFTVAASNGGCSNPPDNSGFLSAFENGTTQGWAGRGTAQVANTTADAHSGAHSLSVTNRTASWNGPTLDITGKMCNGSQYAVIFWVKMAPGQPQTTIRVSLQLTLAGNQTFKTLVANGPVTSSSWVRFKVKPYTFSGAYDNLQIYVESAETAAPFASSTSTTRACSSCRHQSSKTSRQSRRPMPLTSWLVLQPCNRIFWDRMVSLPLCTTTA